MKVRWLLAILLIIGLLKFSGSALNLPVLAQSGQPFANDKNPLLLVENQIKKEFYFLLDLLDPKSGAAKKLDQNVLNDINQLNQALNDLKNTNDSVLPRILSKHLPLHIPNGEQKNALATVETISVVGGDKQVTPQMIEKVTSTLRKVSLPVLKKSISGEPKEPVYVTLFSTQESYGNELIKGGTPPQDIQNYVTQTGGITVGDQILVPMYASHSTSNLANVLTHELTHAVLNEKGIGDALPTWINEGTAVHNGMQAMRQVNPRLTERMTVSMNQEIEAVAQNNQLLPLSASEQDIVSANYNVEWVDYMAVENLIKKDGSKKYADFLQEVHIDGVSDSFQAHFHVSMQTYENEFYRLLQ
ncbi:hypothetical protein [Aneurinibacillus terranovensis]|uniref:hypothetical protein n=1 Tax=Aneurinibacillus terranovensis TaxID=278991 RepID=UPI0004863D52|nr:hypothetical protein [Aneurinibacillus terranovensis]